MRWQACSRARYILLASAVVNQTNLHAEEKRLTVDGRDISGVTLTLEPGVSVSGRVQFTSAPPPELAARMRLEFRHVADRAYNIRGTTVAADGSGAFTVSGLRRGLYMIELVGAGSDSGWWMPSALVGGVDAADTPVEIGGSVTDVMVTVTNAPGEILGAAPSSSSARASSSCSRSIVRLWRPGSRRIAGVRPSSDGQYVVRRLPPGEYLRRRHRRRRAGAVVQSRVSRIRRRTRRDARDVGRRRAQARGPEMTLTSRQLNRATLARQMLLARESMTAPKAVGRLVAMQAQLARPPFVGLWTRLEKFSRDQLIRAVVKKDVVRATSLRGTIHLMTAADFVAFRGAIQPALTKGLQAILRERARHASTRIG